MAASNNTNVTYSEVIIIRTSGTKIHFKEIVILGIFFALFFYSLVTFLRIWNNTYRAIESFYHYEESFEIESPISVPQSRKPSRISSRRNTRKFSNIVTVYRLQTSNLNMHYLDQRLVIHMFRVAVLRLISWSCSQTSLESNTAKTLQH